MFQNKILNIGLYLVYLMPVLILTGPFLSGLALSIVSLIALYLILYRKKIHYLNNKLSLFIILWLIYFVFRSLFSANIVLSLESSLFYARFYFYSLFIYYAICEVDSFKKTYIKILLITLALTFIDAYIQLIFGQNILGFEYSGNRLSSFFGEELILGSYISKLIFCITGIFFITNLDKTYSKYFYILLFFIFLSSIIILYSGERTALFTFFIFLVFLFFNLFKINKNIFAISSIFLFVFFIFLFLSPAIKTRMINTTYDQIFSPHENKEFRVYSIHHQIMYNSAFKMFSDNKMFGLGPKLYREKCQSDDYFIEVTEIHNDVNATYPVVWNNCSTHPHNFLLQLLAETGLFGTLPFIIFYIFLIYWFFKSKNYNFIVLAVLLNFLPLIPSGNFFGNSINALLYLPFGFLIASFYKK